MLAAQIFLAKKTRIEGWMKRLVITHPFPFTAPKPLISGHTGFVAAN